MTESTARAEAEKQLAEAVGFTKLEGFGEVKQGGIFQHTKHGGYYGRQMKLAESDALWNHALSLSEENARLRKERDEAIAGSRIRQDQFNRMGDLADAAIEQRDAAEAKLSGEKYPNLDAAFLATMNEIGQYGFDKYREESFQHKRLTGDRTRHMERIYPDSLSLHAIEHFEMYLRGEIHDHFKTLKHQLAAVAFNAMMEFYFAGLDAPPSDGKE